MDVIEYIKYRIDHLTKIKDDHYNIASRCLTGLRRSAHLDSYNKMTAKIEELEDLLEILNINN